MSVGEESPLVVEVVVANPVHRLAAGLSFFLGSSPMFFPPAPVVVVGHLITILL